MCGRYTLTKPKDLGPYFPNVELPPKEALRPRFNIAPTQPVMALANNRPERFDYFHWGLIPSWAKDPSIGNRMINARAETLAQKPAFRSALRRRRCLVPADGFYEWRKEADGKTKTPMYIRLKSGEPFAFAGLWEVWHAPDGSVVPSCTLVTGEPNEVVRPVHDRMVVILPRDRYDQWLDPGEQRAAKLEELLKPYPAEEMEAYEVSRTVNNPKNDVPACVASPAGPGAGEG